MFPDGRVAESLLLLHLGTLLGLTYKKRFIKGNKPKTNMESEE